MIRRLSVILLPLFLGGWWLEAFEPRPAPSVSGTRIRSHIVTDVVPSDTVQAGHLFVTQLPDSIDGYSVTSYSAEHLPLTSWLLKTSFMWQTIEEDRGDHRFIFDAQVTDTVLVGAWTVDVVIE